MADSGKSKEKRSFFKDEERQTQTRANNITAAKGLYLLHLILRVIWLAD